MAVTSVKTSLCNRALSRIGETEFIEDIDTEERLAAEVCRRLYDDVLLSCLTAHPWPFATRELQPSQSVAEWDETTTYPADGPVRYTPDGDVYVATTFTAWDASTTYAVDELVLGTDGNAYESVQAANLNNDPTTDDGTWWTNLGVNLNHDPKEDGTIWWSYSHSLASGWEYVYDVPSDCLAALALVEGSYKQGELPPALRIPFDVVAGLDGSTRYIATDAEVGEDFLALRYIFRPVTNPNAEPGEDPVDNLNIYPRSFIEVVVWGLAQELALAIKKDPQLADYCRGRFEGALYIATAESLNSRVPPTKPTGASISARTGLVTYRAGER